MQKITIPKQKLSSTQKGKRWGQSCIDELERYIDTDSSLRSTKTEKQINYDLFQGILDKNDFEYVTDPYNFGSNKFPADLRNYDRISSTIMELMGEEMKRPFNFRCVNFSYEAESRSNEVKKKMLLDSLTQRVQGNIDPNNPPPTPASIQKYLEYGYRDIVESTSNNLLKYLIKSENLLYKFNEGFKDCLIAGEEIYQVKRIGNRPTLRQCNPLQITVISDGDSPFVEDSEAIIEERWLSIPTILDEFGWALKTDQITELENLYRRSATPKSNDWQTANPVYSIDLVIDGDGKVTGRNITEDGYVRVIHAEWRSMRKIGFLSFINPETGEVIEELYGEDFIVPEEAIKGTEANKETWSWTDEQNGITFKLTWDWVNEWWEGTKIDKDIYVNIQPLDIQQRSIDNPNECKPSYTGYLYNARNSQAVSLVGRLKPFQYLRDIIFYRTELAFAQSIGPVVMMDLAQIPQSQGMDIDKWIYYMKAMGIMFINSAEKGVGTQQFNAFKEMTLLATQYINQHVMFLEKIDNDMDEVGGVTRQRKGSTTSSDGLGVTQQSITQSTHITEYWFAIHNEVKRRALESLINVAKETYKEGQKLPFIADDMQRMVIEISPNFINEDVGVFVSNSQTDSKNLEIMYQMANVAVQQGLIGLSDAAGILMNTSIADIKNFLKESETRKEQMEQKKVQSEQQSQLQINEQLKEIEELRQDREDARTEATLQNNIDVALIKQDEPDMVEDNEDKMKLDKEKENNRKKEEERRQSHKEKIDKKSIELKEKDLKIKSKKANQRPK